MSKEVTCRVLAPVLEAIQDKKLAPVIWLHKIPYSVEYLQKKSMNGLSGLFYAS